MTAMLLKIAFLHQLSDGHPIFARICISRRREECRLGIFAIGRVACQNSAKKRNERHSEALQQGNADIQARPLPVFLQVHFDGFDVVSQSPAMDGEIMLSMRAERGV